MPPITLLQTLAPVVEAELVTDATGLVTPPTPATAYGAYVNPAALGSYSAAGVITHVILRLEVRFSATLFDEWVGWVEHEWFVGPAHGGQEWGLVNDGAWRTMATGNVGLAPNGQPWDDAALASLVLRSRLRCYTDSEPTGPANAAATCRAWRVEVWGDKAPEGARRRKLGAYTVQELQARLGVRLRGDG